MYAAFIGVPFGSMFYILFSLHFGFLHFAIFHYLIFYRSIFSGTLNFAIPDPKIKHAYSSTNHTHPLQAQAKLRK